MCWRLGLVYSTSNKISVQLKSHTLLIRAIFALAGTLKSWTGYLKGRIYLSLILSPSASTESKNGNYKLIDYTL